MSRVEADEQAAPEAPVDDPNVAGDGAARAADELAGRVSGWVARAVSRAREEGEDVWAEAQELRRRW